MSYNPGDNFVTIDAWGGSGKHQCIWHIAADKSLPGYTGNVSARNAELMRINNITNDRAVATGTKIYLGTSTATTTSGNNSNQAVIKHIGIQSGTDRTIYVEWDWHRHSETEKYEFEWYYSTGKTAANSDHVEWFLGDDGDSGTRKYTTYSPPENAKRVLFKVRPVAKTEEG